MTFVDRLDAGRRLAVAVGHLRGQDVVVIGLSRGGVPVAAEVARALWAPLDVGVVRKLGVPFQPEVAMGAIGEDGARIINDEVIRGAHITDRELAAVERTERTELTRRAQAYRAGRPRVSLRGRTALVVDDGMATGATARAACRSARERGAARVVLAVPVAPPDWAARVGRDADELVCPLTPADFAAVGQFYEDFAPTTDQEVVACLAHARPEEAGIPVVDRDGRRRTLTGELLVPVGATGVVMFAHGSGSGRLSPRNRFVAEAMRQAGLGTLLFDLLTGEEESDRASVFDTRLLAGRLREATRWLRERHPELPVGYFGASTGAAAALWAAAEQGDGAVAAVVSRGGRPDLAGPRLTEVHAPTLLIVGGRDEPVIELNREAQEQLRGETRLTVVPGATHLFEEPGALSEVAELARDWFLAHLPEAASGPGSARAA
ncbi:phosphoribosyltransferase family protein [Streptomyces carpaticus]|uniref:phosphoribosyltransferase family protein n=1 Tax=Streptomyces TaxID=1883 RepID=UPI002205783B|nr:phosphoribosyltransferase family protein [Streptomyces carpaticus]